MDGQTINRDRYCVGRDLQFGDVRRQQKSDNKGTQRLTGVLIGDEALDGGDDGTQASSKVAQRERVHNAVVKIGRAHV